MNKYNDENMIKIYQEIGNLFRPERNSSSMLGKSYSPVAVGVYSTVSMMKISLKRTTNSEKEKMEKNWQSMSDLQDRNLAAPLAIEFTACIDNRSKFMKIKNQLENFGKILIQQLLSGSSTKVLAVCPASEIFGALKAYSNFMFQGLYHLIGKQQRREEMTPITRVPQSEALLAIVLELSLLQIFSGTYFRKKSLLNKFATIFSLFFKRGSGNLWGIERNLLNSENWFSGLNISMLPEKFHTMDVVKQLAKIVLSKNQYSNFLKQYDTADIPTLFDLPWFISKAQLYHDEAETPRTITAPMIANFIPFETVLFSETSVLDNLPTSVLEKLESYPNYQSIQFGNYILQSVFDEKEFTNKINAFIFCYWTIHAHLSKKLLQLNNLISVDKAMNLPFLIRSSPRSWSLKNLEEITLMAADTFSRVKQPTPGDSFSFERRPWLLKTTTIVNPDDFIFMNAQTSAVSFNSSSEMNTALVFIMLVLRKVDLGQSAMMSQIWSSVQNLDHNQMREIVGEILDNNDLDELSTIELFQRIIAKAEILKPRLLANWRSTVCCSSCPSYSASATPQIPVLFIPTAIIQLIILFERMPVKFGFPANWSGTAAWDYIQLLLSAFRVYHCQLLLQIKNGQEESFVFVTEKKQMPSDIKQVSKVFAFAVTPVKNPVIFVCKIVAKTKQTYVGVPFLNDRDSLKGVSMKEHFLDGFKIQIQEFIPHTMDFVAAKFNPETISDTTNFVEVTLVKPFSSEHPRKPDTQFDFPPSNRFARYILKLTEDESAPHGFSWQHSSCDKSKLSRVAEVTDFINFSSMYFRKSKCIRCESEHAAVKLKKIQPSLFEMKFDTEFLLISISLEPKQVVKISPTIKEIYELVGFAVMIPFSNFIRSKQKMVFKLLLHFQ